MGRIRPAALLQRTKQKQPVRRLPVDTCTLVTLVLALGVIVFFGSLYLRKGAKYASRAAASVSESAGAGNATVGPTPQKAELGRKGLTRSALDAKFPRVLLRTTKGDIVVELYAKDCPRTVQNFITHAQSKYYNGVKFHRVIKNFMIQGGDPRGDGTGGHSIWGGTFQDEIRAHLKHEPYTLSMANAGKDTNGSQFFITTVATPHLDGHHTVFGSVIRGKEVVKAIESVETNARDAPLVDVTILEAIVDPELCC